MMDNSKTHYNIDYYRKQLEAISNNATLAIFIMNEAQHCVFMNPAAEKLTGFTLAEVADNPLHNYVHRLYPDGRHYPIEECPIDRVFPENNQEQGEELFVHKDGSFYPVAFTASPVREGKKTVGTIIEVRNITEEKRDKEILLERERLARLTSEVSLALVQSVSLPQILHTCCESVVKYLGAAFARVWTFDKTENVLKLQASAGLYTHLDGEHSRIRVGKYKIGRIAAERQPHLTNEVIGDKQVSDQEWAKREKMTAFAGYPLIVENRLVGVIGMFSRNVLSQSELDALASIANVIALGIERKQSDEILKESEEQYRALVEVSPQIVWTARGDGFITFCNQYWLDYTGLSVNETLGSGWVDAIHPEHRERVKQAWLDAGQRGSWELEIPFRRAADGEYRWHLARGLATRDKTGEITRWVGVAVDIHERQQLALERENLLTAEQDAREESETIRRLGQLISAELDLDKVVQAVTDASTELTGAQFGAFFYNVLNAQGESYMLYSLSGVPREKFSNFPMPRATQVFSPTFHGEGTLRSDNITKDPRFGKNPPYHGMPKGHLPVVSYLAVSVVSRSGEVIGGLFFGHSESGVFSERDERIVEAMAAQAAVAMDNARLYEEAKRERERVEAAAKENERLLVEAQEASRLKDDFLAVVSHEVRTPLNAILGWSSILLSTADSSEETRRAVETINRNARSQAQIIEDILDISRIVTGKLRLDVQLVQPGKVIEAAVDSLLHAAESKNIRLQMLIDPHAGPVSGDPDRLQQIVWNLISNAVKFTPKGGRVQVRLERINSHLEIVVSDSGQGIAAEFLPHVFDRFRQADASSSRTHGGLGLGLSIVKQLVEMHGGSIRAESAGIGQGAAFTVALPVTVANSSKINESVERVHPAANSGSRIAFDCPPNLKNLRVLAVDDEKDSRDLLKNILEQCEAEVLTVGSAEEAMQILPEFEPHILISDIGMPGEDGYSLIKKVRKREKSEKLKRLPAVALTAYARVEDRMKALSAGFQMHVPKPVEPAELAAVIASLVEFGE
jgi:PAS domain S-box-containing protein